MNGTNSLPFAEHLIEDRLTSIINTKRANKILCQGRIESIELQISIYLTDVLPLGLGNVFMTIFWPLFVSLITRLTNLSYFYYVAMARILLVPEATMERFAVRFFCLYIEHTLS